MAKFKLKFWDTSLATPAWVTADAGDAETLGGKTAADFSLATHNHDTTYVNVSGDTMTGPLTLSGDPTNTGHATTKGYVDGIAQGLQIKKAARVASTAAFGTKGTLLVDSANADGDVTYTAQKLGHEGNKVTVAHVNPGTASAALAITVSGNDITVSLATSSTGAITSTSKQVADAINGHASAKVLVSAAMQGLGGGVVATIAKTNLAGGKDVDGAAPSTVDGVTLAAGDRILVKDLNAPERNGIYDVSTVGTGSNGTWTRSSDADTNTEVVSGMFTFVQEGTTHSDAGFVLTTDGAVTLGTTALNFTQFSGAGQIIAGFGLKKSGNTLEIDKLDVDTDKLKDYNTYKSGKDTNGIFTTVEYKRPADATLYMKSVLSNPDANGNYQTDTWDFYDAAGTTITSTIIWTISYDTAGDITSIVKS